MRKGLCLLDNLDCCRNVCHCVSVCGWEGGGGSVGMHVCVCVCVCVGVIGGVWVGVSVWVRKGLSGWDNLDFCSKVCVWV